MKKIFLLSLISFCLTHCMEQLRPDELSALMAFCLTAPDPFILREHQCPHCLKICTYLKTHIKNSHPEVDHSSNNLVKSLKKRLRIPLNQKLLQCPLVWCGKQYKTQSKLLQHKVSHKKKPHLCTTNNCKKKFKTPEELAFHQLKFEHEPTCTAIVVPPASDTFSHDNAAATAPLE